MSARPLIVVGTGLMGASVAAAAKAKGLANVVYGVDPFQAEAAREAGHVDLAYASLSDLVRLFEMEQPVEAGEPNRLLVLAMPVSRYTEVLSELLGCWRALGVAVVTDLGSTKHALIEALARLSEEDPEETLALKERFVASHPMAGSEQSGPAAARADLFKGARVLISPLKVSAPEVVGQVEDFWMALGGLPTPLPLDDHDALLAVVSHFPHLVSYALAMTLARSPLGDAALSLHGGGLRDTTRIAASAPALWADILLDNQAELLRLIPQWRLAMDELVTALEKSDREGLMDCLTEGAQWRRGFAA